MRALAGVGLVAVVALTGCGYSAAEPRVLPSVSAPASASPSPVPTGLNAPTPQGAEAFAKHFYAEIGAAFLAKDPDRIAALVEPTCKVCQTYIQSVTRLRDNGERVDQFAIHVDFTVATPIEAGRTRVDVGWSAPTVTRFDRQGKVISREQGLKGVEEQLDLVRAGDSWKVSDYVRVRVRG